MRAEKHYVFGSFRLDPANQQLWRDRREITLRRKTFEVLRHLVEHPGELVSKAALLDAVWADVTVSDSMPAICVGELRKALGDETRPPRFIETVYGRGYRFIAQIAPPLVSAAPQPRARTRVPAPIVVGREAELAQLRDLFRRAAAGERRVVFVAGEPGIGKTTFVRAFLDSLANEGGVRTGVGQCIEQYGAGEPYMPVLEALTRLTQEVHGDSLIQTLHRLAPNWVAQMPSLLSDAVRQCLAGPAARVTPNRMIREMAEALEALTAEMPLVLCLEDLHWSDSSTLELISAIARRTEPARLLVIATYRPMEAHATGCQLRSVKAELELHRDCDELRLRLLSEENVLEYLRTLFSVQDGQEPLSNLARVIHQRTEGNPLFVVNLADYLVPGKSSKAGPTGARVETQCVLDGVQNDVPQSLVQLIQRNLERLGSQEQQVLEAASVAGVKFSAAAVAVALNRPLSETEIYCECLSRQEQFIQADGENEWPDGTVAAAFRFVHTLYQEFLYGQLSAGRRAEYHRRIAERERAGYGERAAEIAPELAHHFSRANEKGKAVEYLQLAGETAFRRGASVEMEHHYSAALELLKQSTQGPPRDRRQLEILMGLGTARLGSKGLAHPQTHRAFSDAQQLCETLGEPDLLIAAVGGLSSSALGGGRMDLSEDLAQRMLRLATVSRDRRLLFWAHLHLAQVLLLRGEYAKTQEHLNDAGEYLHACDSGRSGFNGHESRPALETHMVIWQPSDTSPALKAWEADVALHLGFPDHALRLSREAVQMAEHGGNWYYRGAVHVCAFCLYDILRDARGVREHADALIPIAEESPYFRSYTDFCASRAFLAFGQIEEAKDRLSRAVSLNEAVGYRLLRSAELLTEAEICAIEGKLDDGLELLAEAMREAEQVGYAKPPIMILRANLLVRSDSSESEIEQAYRSAIECVRAQGNKFAELEATTHFARWLSSQGRNAQAHGMLSAIYNWFTEGFETLALKEANALLDQIKKTIGPTTNGKRYYRRTSYPASRLTE